MSIYVRHMNIVPIHGQRLGHIEGKTSVLYGSKEIFPNKRYIIINEELHLSSLPHAILTAGGGGAAGSSSNVTHELHHHTVAVLAHCHSACSSQV